MRSEKDGIGLLAKLELKINKQLFIYSRCTNSYHLTNILFRKDNLQRRIRTMNHEVNFLKNYRKNIKNNYIFVFNSKTN